MGQRAMPFARDKKAVASPSARRHAPSLRRMLTEPEKKLWMLLRKRLPQEDTHFRKQVALGSYVVDFLCLRARLVIEIDGDQHGAETALRYDEARTNWLEAGGFRVLRFTNRQVMTEAAMVIDTIHAALIGTLESRPPPPTPIPSPRGGGEEPYI